MKEMDKRKRRLTDTELPVRPGDFPLGSPQSRAAARTLLDNFGGDIAPNLLIEFYEPGELHDDGTSDAPVRVQPRRAVIFGGGNKPDIHVNCFADEFLQAFEDRATQIMVHSRGRAVEIALFIAKTSNFIPGFYIFNPLHGFPDSPNSWLNINFSRILLRKRAKFIC